MSKPHFGITELEKDIDIRLTKCECKEIINLLEWLMIKKLKDRNPSEARDLKRLMKKIEDQLND